MRRSPWWNTRLRNSDSLYCVNRGIYCFHASLFSNVLMHETLLHPLQWLIPRGQAWASWDNTPLQFQRELQGWGLSGIRPWTCSLFLWGMKYPRRFEILESLLLLIHNAFCCWPIVTNSRFYFRKISMVIWACWHQLGFFWCGFKNNKHSPIKGEKTSKNWRKEEELPYMLQFSSVFQKEAKYSKEISLIQFFFKII